MRIIEDVILHISFSHQFNDLVRKPQIINTSRKGQKGIHLVMVMVMVIGCCGSVSDVNEDNNDVKEISFIIVALPTPGGSKTPSKEKSVFSDMIPTPSHFRRADKLKHHG